MTSHRTILITGCSDGGLGSSLALAFHRAGWRVLASARNLSKLQKTTEAGIESVQLDTLSDESIARSVSEVQKLTGGALDVLLNNAGAGYSMPLTDVDIDEARRIFDLNVWSLLSVTRAFLPLLQKSTHGGMLVNNTSCSSVTTGGLPLQGVYNASKAAATSLTETLRLELQPFGIRVVNLLTGAVRSNFFSNIPSPTLPSTSAYSLAREAIERAMSGEDPADHTDPDQWAQQIVQAIDKSNPSFWVWKGRFSFIVRLTLHLPVGLLDDMVKKMRGLDVLERKIKEQGGPSKVKLA